MKKRSKQKIDTEADYMMALAKANGGRFGTCDRAKVGVVIVTQGGEIISNGWNTSPKGIGTCDKLGHLMVDGHCVRTVHAEVMALSKLLLKRTSIKGCKVYITHKPCLNCLKFMVAAGVKHIIYETEYNNIVPMEFYNQIIESNKVKLEKYTVESQSNVKTNS